MHKTALLILKNLMSFFEYSEIETPLIKNEIIMSNFNIYGNGYTPLKEEEKYEEKSLSEENFQNFIKKEFGNEMTSKNNISYIYDDDMDDTLRYQIPNFKPISSSILLNSKFNLSSKYFYDINSPNKSNDNNPINKLGNEKIFKIEKIKHKKIFKCMQRKRELGDKSKKNWCDWDNITVPKEKHFHFDRKKHRIVFQRKHLKVIYSIVDLAYPFNFSKCFDMIKNHIGDKTLQNYKEGKSFHIIKINNQEKIVTFKDKKILLRQNRMNKVKK